VLSQLSYSPTVRVIIFSNSPPVVKKKPPLARRERRRNGARAESDRAQNRTGHGFMGYRISTRSGQGKKSLAGNPLIIRVDFY
jgi:hypothetical protein